MTPEERTLHQRMLREQFGDDHVCAQCAAEERRLNAEFDGLTKTEVGRNE